MLRDISISGGSGGRRRSDCAAAASRRLRSDAHEKCASPMKVAAKSRGKNDDDDDGGEGKELRKKIKRVRSSAWVSRKDGRIIGRDRARSVEMTVEFQTERKVMVAVEGSFVADFGNPQNAFRPEMVTNNYIWSVYSVWQNNETKVVLFDNCCLISESRLPICRDRSLRFAWQVKTNVHVKNHTAAFVRADLWLNFTMQRNKEEAERNERSFRSFARWHRVFSDRVSYLFDFRHEKYTGKVHRIFAQCATRVETRKHALEKTNTSNLRLRLSKRSVRRLIELTADRLSLSFKRHVDNIVSAISPKSDWW